MARWFLAVAALLGGAVGMASADYILVIANVGAPKLGPPPPPPNQMGMPPNQMGMPPNQMGMPPNQMGIAPPPASSSAGPTGMPPNQMGMPPNQMGMPPNQMGMPPQGQAIQVAAVVEVEASFKALKLHEPTVQANNPQLPSPIPLETHGPLGVVRLLNIYGVNVSFKPFEHPTVAKTFDAKAAQVFKKDKDKPDLKPDAEQIVELAKWALAHDLTHAVDVNDKVPDKVPDKVADLMKKLADNYPDNPVAKAFQKVQADLDRLVTKDGAAADMQKQLGDGYKAETLKGGKGHYVLFYNINNSDQAEVQERLARLEDALRTFYYWWALQGVETVAPGSPGFHVPDERLPSLLTSKEPEFERTRDSLSDPPIVAEGFFGRRENLSVFCARPLDERYDMLDKTAAPFWSNGFNRFAILSGKEKAGYPPGTAKDYLAYVGMTALLLKALEDESERAAVSHDASRQLLFASGLLPRAVAVPEWVQFGMGSFFETPVHSPWPSPTGPSSLYLPVYRRETAKDARKFEGDPFKTMRKIVTDGYFRELHPDDLRRNTPEALRARAATWSLMYFLAKNKRENLLRYFQLLGDMPRDLELDEGTLWETYARAFDAYDPKTKRMDEAKLGQIAASWQSFVSNETFEAEDLIKELDRSYTELNNPEGSKPPSP